MEVDKIESLGIKDSVPSKHDTIVKHLIDFQSITVQIPTRAYL